MSITSISSLPARDCISDARASSLDSLDADDSAISHGDGDYIVAKHIDGKPEYIICITDRYSDSCNHLVYDTKRQWLVRL